MLNLLLIAVLAIHDGDTLTINLPCNLPAVCQHMPVRIYGIDTPELNDKRPDIKRLAALAKARVMALTNKEHKVELKIVGRDKYFRLDGIVFSDGVSIADTLQAEGLAKPYSGEGPKPW